MTADLALNNLLSYFVQVLVLVAAGAVIPWLARVRHPRSQLVYYQALLAVCLLLPAVQPWRQEIIVVKRAAATRPAVTGGVPLAPVDEFWGWEEWTLAALGAGAALRALWLAMGLRRLGRYRAAARPLDPLPPGMREARAQVGTQAQICVSNEIDGPVTFGFLRPAVLVPESTLRLGEDARRAVVIHELLHVRRHDWLWLLCEELAGVALWFHPAVWWLASRIRLAREETVDRQVLELLRSREPYIDALLAMARARVGPDLVPAAPFAGRHDLARRVRSILSEVNMSRRRLLLSYLSAAAVLGVTVWVSTQSFPLKASPQIQETRDAAGVALQAAPPVVHRARVDYPEQAKRQRIEGVVTLEARLAPSGSVTDARVLSGPPELRKAALESLLQWHFQNDDYAEKLVTVAIEFKLAPQFAVALPRPASPAAAEPVVEAIHLAGLPPGMREKLEPRLAPYRGRPMTDEMMAEVASVVREVEEHAGVSWMVNPVTKTAAATVAMKGPAAEAAGTDASGGPRIRVGGNVQSEKIISKVRPVYPPLAKQARIQGTVRFAVVIAANGTVKDVQLIAGHPLLAEAAKEAVEKWVYQTTLLNGNPVEVITQVDVNFTLIE